MGASRRDFLKNSGLLVMAGAGFMTADQWARGEDLSDFKKRFQGKGDNLGGGTPPTGPGASDEPKGRSARLETPTIVTIFLRGGADGIDDPACSGANWVRKIKQKDAYRRFYQLGILASSGAVIDTKERAVMFSATYRGLR